MLDFVIADFVHEDRLIDAAYAVHDIVEHCVNGPACCCMLVFLVHMWQQGEALPGLIRHAVASGSIRDLMPSSLRTLMHARKDFAVAKGVLLSVAKGIAVVSCRIGN